MGCARPRCVGWSRQISAIQGGSELRNGRKLYTGARRGGGREADESLNRYGMPLMDRETRSG
jgi:hypothetical protein